jgi:glycopeptide antibiotics resistance protein
MRIPVGVFTYWLWKWNRFLAAAGFSITIELFQLLTARKLMEFNDVLHDMVGIATEFWIVIADRQKVERNMVEQ